MIFSALHFWTRAGRRLIAVALSTFALISLTQAESAYRIEKAITYGRAGEVDLKLDLARPETGAGPFPAIVWIHGGGWRMGTREWGDGEIVRFAERGYVAVTISYRFAPQFKFPAQIYDAKAAVRYLRAHAKELNVDVDHIGIIGESSGGHMALMVGLTAPKDGLEGESGSPGFSSAVQAVVSFCSLTDFTQLKVPGPDQAAALEAVLKSPAATVLTDFSGTADTDDPVWKKMSPVTYADADDPPVLMFQGGADDVVPEEQAHLLDRVFEWVGTRHRLVVVRESGHVWKGQARVDTTREMLEFFDANLKPKPNLAEAAPKK